MTECSLCGKVEMTFTCMYCGNQFCTEHRLPESHGCPGLLLARDATSKHVSDTFSGELRDEEEDSEQTIKKGPLQRQSILKSVKKSRFSKQEIRDLSIASILVVLVSVSIIGNGYQPLGLVWGFVQIWVIVAEGFSWFPPAMIGAFLFSFLTHELAHKFVAQHYGMWSEFRMMMQGYYLSAIAILLSFPIFGTGAVFTSAAPNESAGGKTKVAGPASNLLIGGVVMVCTAIVTILQIPLAFYAVIFANYIMTLNAILGLFNMIPLEPFDGAAIFRWNKTVWAATSVLLLVVLAWASFVFIL